MFGEGGMKLSGFYKMLSSKFVKSGQLFPLMFNIMGCKLDFRPYGGEHNIKIISLDLRIY